MRVRLLVVALLLAQQCFAAVGIRFDTLMDSQDSSSAASDDDSSSAADSSEEFIENVAGWRPIGMLACPKGQFGSGLDCHQCTICGPDSYEREPCHSQHGDTRCEWCLSGAAKPGQGDFNSKCTQLVKLRNEFRRVMARQHQQQGSQGVGGLSTALHFSSIQMDASGWLKAEMAVEMVFYLALIALVLAVIRFLCKARQAHSAAYRTVQVSPPPPAMDDMDQKNIVRAADSIRQKLGHKGYDRLEEEFI